MTLAFAHVNLADAAVITASSALTLAPASRLQHPHVARRWRGRNGGVEALTIDLLASVAWDTIALLGLNLGAAGTTRVRASNSDPSGQAGEVYDSGAAAGRVDENYAALILARGESAPSRYVRIDLAQAGLDSIEAGRLSISLRTAVAINFNFGWNRAWIDPTRKTEGVAGQMFNDVREPYRTLELTLAWLTEAEKNGFVETIDRDLGIRGDFLTMLDPASTRLDRDSVWGFQDTSTPVFNPVVVEAFSKTYRIRERL